MGGFRVSQGGVELTIATDPLRRRCGDCQLCCKLLPSKPLDKAAGERCRHQRAGKGCMIYAQRPRDCALWSCRWLVSDDTAELSRPDRSHYVIDIVPDFARLQDKGTGAEQNIEVVQIWVDPDYRDAHRDPALRAYVERRAREGVGCLIRFSEREAMGLFAPPMSADGEWHEVTTGVLEPEHTARDKVVALQAHPRGPQRITDDMARKADHEQQ